MRKFSKYLFVFACFFFAVFAFENNVSAKITNLYTNQESVKVCVKEDQGVNTPTTLWEIMCSPYHVIEGKEDDSDKYHFAESDHNYTFDYDYEIEFDSTLTVGYARIYRFLGISEETPIAYSDIDIGSKPVLPEKFIVYKYQPLTSTFNIEYDAGINTTGSYLISQPGIYKLETYVEHGGNSYITYLVYEDTFYYASLRTIDYDSDTQNLVYNLKVSTPRYLPNCNNISVKVMTTNSDIMDCGIYYGDSVGEYDIVISTVNQWEYVPDKSTTVLIGSTNLTAKISYDSAIPEIENDVIIYYPTDFVVDEFAMQYNDEPLVVPSKSVAIFKYSDMSSVKASANNKECNLTHNSKFICEIDNTMGPNITYKLVDAYGNETNVIHYEISFGNLESINKDGLKDAIEIEGNEITFTNTDEYDQFEKICLFYGTSIDVYTCAYMNTTLTVASELYYVGPVTVILADFNNNIVSIAYDNVTLDTGYDPNLYIVNDIEGNLDNTQDISLQISQLVAIACAGDTTCLDSVKIYGKYGEYKEILGYSDDITDLKLPTYLEILNKGYASKSCAFQRCNETVEVYVSYKVGGVEQQLTAKYNYIDKLPQIANQLDDYEPTRKYDFSELDVTKFQTKLELYAFSPEEQNVTLVDGDGMTYSGNIDAAFVRYTNRSGEVTTLNRQPHAYLTGKKDFGYYLLECRVKITKNISTDTDVTGDVYAKSFFINVELADTKKPTLTLNGDAEITVKQYDVFKDPEFKCVDNSGCSVTINYYYESESNSVDKVDTTIPGTYTIKYTAIDADGNVTILTRTVYVESVNAMNATAIIIIIVVVLVFAGSIALAIWFEIRRRRAER